MKKTKHNPPRKKNPELNFIEFTKLQTNYLREVRDRQIKEFNDALTVVYEELGIIEDVIQAPPGMYNLKQDLSGVDILPVAQQDEEITDPEKPEGSEPALTGQKPEEKNH